MSVRSIKLYTLKLNGQSKQVNVSQEDITKMLCAWVGIKFEDAKVKFDNTPRFLMRNVMNGVADMYRSANSNLKLEILQTAYSN